MKTNKSFTKRLRVTRTGQNHFNAKERRNIQLNKKRTVGMTISNKARSRFLPN